MAETRRTEAPQGDIRQGEALLCSWVQGLYLDAMHGRERVIGAQEWSDNVKAYWGSYWPDALPSYKSKIGINELKRLILSELSDLTDNMPTVYVSKAGETRAKTIERALQAYWQRAYLDLTVLDACLDASVFPCGFFEIPWDPLKQNGQGDVVVRARAPQTVYPDPYATDDDDWRYVITCDVMDLNEVRAKWPDQGYRVRPDTVRPDGGAGPMLTPPGRPGGVGLLTPLYPVTAPQPTHGMDTRVSVYTCYVKDATLEVKPQLVKDPEGVDHLRRSVRYKYPQGRLIQATSEVVLYDDRVPYGDGFPILRCLLQPTLHGFWPQRSLVAELLELQKAADKLDSLVVENALRLQKAIVIAEANSGVDSRTFGDIPGQVVTIRPGSKVEFRTPPALPADLIQAGPRLRSEMQRLLGHQPSRAGQQGRGNVSAELTETEISQAMGLTRLRARFLHATMHKLVSKILARMGQFYTHTRVLPFMEGSSWAPVIWQPVLDWQDYAAFIDPNSFQVQSKTMTKRLALALAKLGRMASDEDLYKVLEFPGGDEIAKRNKQQLALAAQARANQPKPGRKKAA